MADQIEERVARHYARSDLERAILDAPVATGKDLERLTTSDLAPVDEFHTGGREATIELAAQMEIAPGSHLLDIGCGIGGASRYIADACRCRVTGSTSRRTTSGPPRLWRGAPALARTSRTARRARWHCRSRPARSMAPT